jgi:hypothetical protein
MKLNNTTPEEDLMIARAEMVWAGHTSLHSVLSTLHRLDGELTKARDRVTALDAELQSLRDAEACRTGRLYSSSAIPGVPPLRP